MKELIEALQIFLKYGQHSFPFYCSGEIMEVHYYEFSLFSKEDIAKLEELGFYYDSEEDYFFSSKHGS